jgi:hypothetical protein
MRAIARRAQSYKAAQARLEPFVSTLRRYQANAGKGREFLRRRAMVIKREFGRLYYRKGNNSGERAFCYEPAAKLGQKPPMKYLLSSFARD